MKEEILKMGTEGHLVGVLSHGSETSNAPVVLMFNAGLLHRVGPFRLWVRLARKLAEQNIPSLRFDIRSHGDSSQPNGIRCEPQEGALESIIQAMNDIESRMGRREFIIVGLCSGADYAHPAAKRDPRIRGAVLIDGYGYKTPGFDREAKRIIIKRRILKSISWRSWKNFIQSRLVAKTAKNGSKAIGELVSRDFPAREQIENDILAFLAEGRRLHYVYTGGLPYFNHERQFWDMFPRLKPASNLSCRHFPKTDHTFSLYEDRSQLLNDIVNFVVSTKLDAHLTLVDLFEAQVKKTPHLVALKYGDSTLTYQELNERANQLARWLRTQGAGPDTLVGVMMERSIEMVIALYGIIKSGAAYLPIEPSTPQARIDGMIEDAQLKIVLTQQDLFQILNPGLERSNLDQIHSAENMAYCIFTSGSTGRPKGVMISHRSICNRLLWMQAEYQMSPGDRVLQKTPFTFDVSVWEFFWPLQVGATLVVLAPEMHRSSKDLIQEIVRSQITHLHFVPSMLSVFLEDPSSKNCSSIKKVYCSGEALPFALQERFFSIFPEVELHNLYGPTEAAVDITYWQCKKNDPRGLVPIGRPVWNSQVYILDENFKMIPRGETGELYLGGVQLARGYLARPELTAERFIPNPFSKEPGAKLYKTGDLARWLSDGTLEYLGRNDFQVKLNGLRIELGEIENIVCSLKGICQSAVTVITAPSGAKQLACYLVKDKDIELSSADVRDRLKSMLPSYMVPQYLVWLEAMPISSSGKLDRKGLPQPTYSERRLPLNPTQKEVSFGA